MYVEDGILMEVKDEDINPDGSFTFPEGVTSIDDRAFAGNSNLKTLVIPNGIINMGDEIFSYCVNLEKITIPEGVTYIGRSNFRRCRKLKEIILPEGIDTIENSAFEGCSNLEKIVIPKGVYSIGEDAFKDCTNLKEITLPEGVEIVGNSSFGRYDGTLDRMKYISQKPDGDFVFSTENLNGSFEIPSMSVGWLLYGVPELNENVVKDMIKIEQSISKFVTTCSSNYSYVVMKILIYKMMSLIGVDEIENLLKIDEISEEDLKRHFDDIREIYEEYINSDSPDEGSVDWLKRYLESENVIYEEYLEKRFFIDGIDGLTINIIKEINKKLGTLKEKDKFAIYKEINSCLAQNDYAAFNDMLEKIFGKDKQAELQENMRNKVIENITDGLIIKNEKLPEELRIPDAQINPVKRMVKKYIKENGSKNVENIEKWFEENTGHGTDFAANWIQMKKETIISLISESVNENIDILSKEKTILKILKQGKEKIQKPWIRNIIETKNQKGFSKEELQTLFGEEYVSHHEGELKSKLLLKSGVSQEDFYNKIYARNVRGIVTYEQIERMFGGINIENVTDEELQSFRRYYKKYKDEILSNAEVQRYLPEIFVLVKDGTQIDKDPQNFIRKIVDKEYKYDSRYGDSELAQSFLHAVFKSEEVFKSEDEYQNQNWEKYKGIYKKMNEREGITIPPVRIGAKNIGNYFGKILRADDPLAIAIGTITDCCQEFGNVGETAMLHSVTEKNGGIFAVFDTKGRVVAQSWVWRKGSRLCFDNIELAKERNDIKQSEIYEIYKKAAEDATRIDVEMMNKLLKEGKITQKQYMEYSLKEVTVGMGYLESDLSNKLKENPKGAIVHIDGGIYSDATTETRLLFKRDKEDIKKDAEAITRESIKELPERDSHKNNVKYGYKKMDEIEYLSSEFIGRKLEQIKEVERIVFPEEQQLLQRCEDVQGLSETSEIPLEKLKLVTNRDSTFYMLYGEKNKDTLYIAELAMLNGVNSQNRVDSKSDLEDDDPRKRGDALISSAEALVATYQVLLDAAREEKNVEVDATNSTALINIKNMERNGLITISDSEEYTDVTEKTKVLFEVNEEKVQEALEELAEKLKKAQEKRIEDVEI